MKNDNSGILYIHVQTSERFVLMNGMSFREFVASLEKPLEHLLLLKHDYDETEFNHNIRLEYVDKENIEQLANANIREFGPFCWLDFKDVDALDDLTGKDLAELLYLGHMKHHLKSPFYSALHNQFVYLSEDDDWLSKIYYRNMSDYYYLLGTLLTMKIEDHKVDRTWFGIKKKRKLPVIPLGVIESLKHLLSEGVVFSFKKAKQTRSGWVVPAWLIGDFINMDEMLENYEDIWRQKSPDLHLIYNGKAKDWHVEINT